MYEWSHMLIMRLNNSGHTEPYYYIGSHLIIHTESYHTNADAYFRISDLDPQVGALNIYMENYAPIHGIQFTISLDNIGGVDLGQLSFGTGQGGRAEEFGWTVSANDSGLVIGMAQFTGNPIPGGEGLLTQIPWNISSLGQANGQVTISNLQVSGYFGSEVTYEIGSPLSFETGLNLDDDILTPLGHKLLSAYPNPFNPNLRIPFELKSQTHVELNIYDLRGQKVETLINESLLAGAHEVSWNASSYASGVYVCTLESNGKLTTKKVVLIK